MIEVRKDIIQATYDLGGQGEQNCLMVARWVGNDWYIKSFYGKDADFVYGLLTQKSVGQAIYDLQNNIIHKEVQE